MPATLKRELRIGLVTTLETNIGDDFVRDALLHVIRRLLPDVRTVCIPVNKHRPAGIYPPWHPIRWFYKRDMRLRKRLGPLRRKAERWLPPLGFSRFDGCDFVLQCGTPVMWEGCRNSEWSGPIWRDVLLRLGRKGVPIFNVGGGSCYPWERRPATLVGNPDEGFVRLMCGITRLTTVRDSLAQALIASLGHQAGQLCCPALLTGRTHVEPAAPSRKVIVNFMPGGGHFDFEQGIDADAWQRTMGCVLAGLRRMGWKPLVIAHNTAEAELATQLWPAIPCVHPESPRAYFEIVRDAMFGIFNRLHAGVAVAGLGIPSISIGTDSRMLMLQALGLPVFYVKEAAPNRLLAAVEQLAHHRAEESHRLLALRESTLAAYESCLSPFLAACLA